jgi:hypothetical protein
MRCGFFPKIKNNHGLCARYLKVTLYSSMVVALSPFKTNNSTSFRKATFTLRCVVWLLSTQNYTMSLHGLVIFTNTTRIIMTEICFSHLNTSYILENLESEWAIAWLFFSENPLR